MKTLSEKMNFSFKEGELENAIKIDKRKDINYCDTLCLYLSENDVKVEETTEEAFETAVETFKNFGINEANPIFYFSIDKE